MGGAPAMPMPGSPQPTPQAPQPPKVKEYDLKKGAYGVSVSIGKSFQTRLQQGADEMGQILTAAPELMQVLGDLYFKFRDFPGAPEISKRLAKMREKTMPGLGESEEGAPPPEQLAAELEGLKQQLQVKEQQLAALVQKIETEQVKQQAQLEKAKMDNQTKAMIAESQQRTDVLIQEMRNDIQEFTALLSAKAAQVNTAEEQRQAERTGDKDRQHEAAMGELSRPEPEAPEPPEPLPMPGGDR